VGVKASFEKIEKAIKKLKKCNFRGKIIVNAIITPINYKEIKEIAEYFKDLEVDSLRFQHLNFLKEKELKAAKNELKKSNIKHFIGNPELDTNALKKELKRVKNISGLPIFFIPVLNNKDIDNWYLKKGCESKKCLFIHRGLYVDADGICHSCQNIRNNIGDLKNESLFKIFNSKKAKQFRKDRKKYLSKACLRCCKLS
jgi:MoaA/NifB/PqqE/SkfB family radical SAM enzyme